MTALNLKASLKVTKDGKTESINSAFDGEVSLREWTEWLKYNLIRISVEALREEQGKGFDKSPITLVDGKFGKNILDVHPFGKVEFVSKKVSASEVIIYTYQQLLKKSKVVTGTYISNHMVLHNNKLVARNLSEVETWVKTANIKPGDNIVIVNLVPYARKLERLGVTAARTQSRRRKARKHEKRKGGTTFLTANGAYFLTHRDARNKFKGNVGIYFKYIHGSQIQVTKPSASNIGKPFRHSYDPVRNPKNAGPYLYPSIQIRINKEGVNE